MPIKKLKPRLTKAKKTKPDAVPSLNLPSQEIHHHYYPSRPYQFNFGRLSFGLFLVIVGILYLAKNFGWLTVDFNLDLWQLWPIFLVFWGLSLLTGKHLASIIAGIVLTLTVLTVMFLLMFGQAETVSPAVNTYNSSANTATP